MTLQLAIKAPPQGSQRSHGGWSRHAQGGQYLQRPAAAALLRRLPKRSWTRWRSNGGRNGGGQQYRGQIDEVAVWNRALSATDIRLLFLKGLGGEDIPLVITNIVTAGGADSVDSVTITFSNIEGSIYRVERSTDLLIWEELDDGVDGPDFTDSDPPAGAAWYRVSELDE